MKRKIKVTVKTESYERSHGKKPRGTGLWFFFSSSRQGQLVSISEFQITGTYTDAKSQAVKWAQEQGFHTIEVGA